MLGWCPYLRIYEEEQKQLRQEFNDSKIYYGYNVQKQSFQAWYKPNSSRPYMIASVSNVYHAIKILRKRVELDRKRAKDVLREIDEHNKKLLNDKDDDVMHEVQVDLRKVASGRKLFIPPKPERSVANATV